jgi:hypothetical protein
MKDRVATGHRPGQRIQVEIVAADEFEIWNFSRARQKILLAGGEIVPTHDQFAIGQQPICKTAANEARRTRDEYFGHVKVATVHNSLGFFSSMFNQDPSCSFDFRG